MSFVFASRTMDLVLLTVCSTFLGEFHATLAAVPFPDDNSNEKEFIIDELANIIKDQSYRMRDNAVQYDDYPVPRNRMTANDNDEDDDDDKQSASFAYDLKSDLPELNTGNLETPFAVLPNDRRYYQPDFTDHLVPPDAVTRKFQRKDRSKSSEVQSSFEYGSHGYESSKVTTENLSTSEISMDLQPQATYVYMPFSANSKFSQDDYYFFAKAAGVGLAVLVVLIISSIACFRMQRNNKAAADVEYPAYGITGPNKDMSPTGDRRLAQSAQMYHYQQQKQLIIAMETNSSVKESRCGSVTDPDSDDDNEEGDYTVYECPGLAPAGEMEVKNPLFHDDNTPASPNANISKENIAENDVIPTVPVPK